MGSDYWLTQNRAPRSHLGLKPEDQPSHEIEDLSPNLVLTMLDFKLYDHKTSLRHINQFGRETALVVKHWDLVGNECRNWVYAGPQHSAHCLSSGWLCFQALVLIEPIIEQLSSLVPVPRTRIVLLGLPAMLFMWKEGFKTWGRLWKHLKLLAMQAKCSPTSTTAVFP